MKSLLIALTTTAALLIAIPSFACDGHAKSDEETTTTASTEAESCGSKENCGTCEKCTGEKAKKKADKKETTKS